MLNHTRTEAEIRQWLVSYMADALNISEHEIDVQMDFKNLGLDSSASVILTGDLGEWLGYDLEPTLLMDYQNIVSLARHLANTANMEEYTL